MKNTTLIWNALLPLAVGALFYLHFKGDSAGSSASVSDMAKGKKIVYVQADSLLKNYEYYKDRLFNNNLLKKNKKSLSIVMVNSKN